MTTSEKIQNILDNNKSLFANFSKFYGQNQDGKNSYETGCIQTVNALMPVIEALIIELDKEPIK